MKHYNILGYYLIRKHINYILRSSIVYTAKPPLWREFSSKQDKAQQSILAWKCSNIGVVVTYFDLHGLSSDQWATSWEFWACPARMSCENRRLSEHSELSHALAQMQTMCNHTERCCISNHHRKPSMHNKRKGPIVLETNFLPLISAGVVYSSSLNIFILVKLKKRIVVAFKRYI